MHDIDSLANDLYTVFTSDKRIGNDNNWVVVGSNSTGKTLLISKIIDLALENKNQKIYYVDPCNRTVFDQETEAGYSKSLSDVSLIDILANRRRSINFTKQDVFDTQVSGGALAFSELVKRFELYQSTIEKFLQKSIKLKKPDIISEDYLNKLLESRQRSQIFIDGTQEIASLSNSEAARIRLIMEIMLAQEKGCFSVIIDEFDSHFDNVRMVEFMQQITEEFSSTRFLFVIHNFESLVNIWNMRAVLFNIECNSGTYEHIIDTNNISEIGDAYRTFNKYMGRKREYEVFLSDCLADYMSSDTLSESLLIELKKINRGCLNNRERIIIDYLLSKDHG